VTGKEEKEMIISENDSSRESLNPQNKSSPIGIGYWIEEVSRL
jgi:hypothetical protein